jgi:acyl phosphate:glycerol-3-phosphate acyltransferase
VGHPSPVRLLAAAGLGYVVGTTPSADVAARLASSADGTRVDLRTAGTGNPGAANAMGQLGRRWGIGVLVVDAAKGVVASRAGRALAGDAGAGVASMAAIVGHCFPVWSGFRGGKGVATSIGAAVDVFPAVLPPVLAVTGAAQTQLHDTDRAIVVATSAWVGGSLLWWRRRWPTGWGVRPGPGLALWTASTAAFVLWRFKAQPRAALPAAGGAVDPVVEAAIATD